MVRRHILVPLSLTISLAGAPWLVLAQEPPEPPDASPTPSAQPPVPAPEGSAEPPTASSALPAESAPPPSASAPPAPAPPAPAPPASTPLPPASAPPILPPPPVAPIAPSSTAPVASLPPHTTPPPMSPASSNDEKNSKANGRENSKANSENKDNKDKERGWEWLWLSGEGGFEHLALTTIQSEGKLIPGIENTSSSGGFVGVAAGLRLWILTLGLHARAAQFSEYMYWSLDPEVTIHFSTQGIQPYLLLGAGYSALGSLDQKSLSSQAGATVRGLNVRAGFGLDFYLTDFISLGALGTGELVAMTRPGVSMDEMSLSGSTGAQGGVDTNDPEKAQGDVAALKAAADAKAARIDGSGVGLAGALSIVLGLHF